MHTIQQKLKLGVSIFLTSRVKGKIEPPVRQKVDQAVSSKRIAHCPAHRLNLVVVFSCKVLSINNVKTYIGEVAHFWLLYKRQ